MTLHICQIHSIYNKGMKPNENYELKSVTVYQCQFNCNEHTVLTQTNAKHNRENRRVGERSIRNSTFCSIFL